MVFTEGDCSTQKPVPSPAQFRGLGPGFGRPESNVYDLGSCLQSFLAELHQCKTAFLGLMSSFLEVVKLIYL